MSAVERRTETDDRLEPVAPLLPLALLESIRAHDRPREVLEDEDLAASLPRRLGLTGVVESQIRRYEESRKRGQSVQPGEVRDLLRLVLRRPDAESILRNAGERLSARQRKRGLSVIGVMPGTSRSACRRAVRSLLRRISGGASIEVDGWPLRIRIRGGITTDLDSAVAACILYGSALESLISSFVRGRPALEHLHCQTLGEPACEWSWTEA